MRKSFIEVAYRVIDKGNMVLSVSDGILYEHSRILDEENNAYIYHTYRNSLRIQYRVNYKDILKLNSAGYYQPSLQYKDDYILMGTVRLDVKIWKWLNFTTAITYNNVSRTNRENTLFTYGLIAERIF